MRALLPTAWIGGVTADFAVVSCGYVSPEVARAFNVTIERRAVAYADADALREPGAYLRYIVRNYGAFAENTAFIHGHDNSWHQATRIFNLLHAARAMVAGATALCEGRGPLVYLNSPTPLASAEPIMFGSSKVSSALWARCVAPDVANPGDVPACGCCAQFVVSRARLMANPLAMYKRLCAFQQANPFPERGHTPHEWDAPNFLEHAWAALLGEHMKPCAWDDLGHFLHGNRSCVHATR